MSKRSVTLFFGTQHNNGMHPTADTPALMQSESLVAAGDAWR